MSEERGPRGVEWLLLAVIAAIAGFSLLATGAVRAVDFVLVEYLMAGALALSIVRLWVHRQPTFHLSPVLWTVLAFASYCFVRFLQTDIPYVAEDELIRVWIYTMFFGVITLHLFRPQYLQTFLGVLAVLAVGCCLYAAYQYFAGSNRVWHFIRPASYTRRGSGTFINPNNFAGYMAVLLPMALSFVMVGRMKVTARMLIIYAALMFTAGLLVAASRGALLGAGVGTATLALLLLRQPAFRLPAVIMMAVLLLGGIGFAAQDSLTQWRLQETQKLNLEKDTRIMLWQAGSAMWRDHLLLGAGPAHYDELFPEYRPEPLQKVQPLYAHNEYINTLADYGLVGALLILGAIIAAELAFRYGWSKFRRDGDSLDSARSNRLALVIGASASVTVALAHAMFDYNFHVPAYGFLMVFLFASLAVFWRTDNTRWWWRPKLAGKLFLTVVCVASAAAFVWHGHKRQTEQRLLERLKRADINKPEYLELLHAANAVEPKNSRTLYEIGEYYRAGSWAANRDFKDEGHRAMEWFAKAALLHPHDSYIPLRQAMTLTWIGEYKDTKGYLDRAEALNPKDYYTLAQIGWCYFQQENYREALKYLEHSFRLRGYDNSVAEVYLPITRERLKAAPGK
jgi:O-antigen ligase